MASFNILMFRATIPHDEIIGDYGSLRNSTGATAPFTHGLQGVNQALNWILVNTLLVAFMLLLGFTMACQWTAMYNAHLRRMFTMGQHRDQRYWMFNQSQIWPKTKQHIILAPLGSVRHNKEIQLSSAISIGTLPSRFHTILLLLYVALNITYCLILDWTESNSAAILAELRGRSGVLAAFNLIPTILFALRNNPLIPLLDISYDTFNLLHRWCARIVVIESIIHTTCWMINTGNAGGMKSISTALGTSTSYRSGLLASCAFVFMALAATSPIRHAFYETFLNLHRALAMLALVGVYIHLDRANLPQLPYIQFTLLLWAAEWLWRSLRIVVLNVSRRRGITRVTIEALPSEACRLTFDLRTSWRWRPGCHVHAYLPMYAFWSSHPFSVAWADEKAPGKTLDLEYGEQTDNSWNSEKTSVSSLPRSGTTTSISLIVRARTGVTRQIYDKAKNSPGGMLQTWGAIEGPYGGHNSFASYGTVVLFAGGVGITHCISFIYHLLKQYQEGTSSTQRILLVWSVPNTEALEWVRTWMDLILRMGCRREILRIHLFVTKPRHRAEVISNTGSVRMFPGRCNPQTIVEKEFAERIGAMGVTVCGPGAFADSVRATVRSVVAKGAVDLHEEAFTY